MSILKDIWNFFTGQSAKVKAAIEVGIDYSNKAKSIINSPLVRAAVAATPTQLDNAGLDFVNAGLTAFIGVLGWAERAINDFEADPDAKAAALTVIAAKATKLAADYNGAKVTIQQAIATVPVAYDKSIIE